MKGSSPGAPRKVSGFRLRIFFAITLLVGGLAVPVVVITQRHLSAGAEQELQASVERQMAAAAHTRRVRQAVLLEICDSLAREPRIHAALEDNALDLLYPSAQHELRQLMRERVVSGQAAPLENLQARFYRFLDARGALIPTGDTDSAGSLSPETEARLTLAEEPGYLRLPATGSNVDVVEVLTVPIVSNETFLPIAALVVGFPFEAGSFLPANKNLRAGIWVGERLLVSGFSDTAVNVITDAIRSSPLGTAAHPMSLPVELEGTGHRILLRPLNAGSAYPVAHEVFIASMAELEAEQNSLRTRILGLAAVLVLSGLGIGHVVARRLARPVEALAEASEEEHVQRVRAETELDHTYRELERAARFSADASHQLKTPVAVMRAGLEELLIDHRQPAHLRQEIHALIRQTGRLTAVIEDLLLLSRLDTGHVHLALQPQNLRLLIDGLLDDFSILPDADGLTIDVSVDDDLMIEGDCCYTSLILQSLLENARKYNRPGGRISIVAEPQGPTVHCRIGNTGTPIPGSTQAHIFERFHRGVAGETVAGYGLGLNLARELARRHGGALRLLRSQNDWTEFELELRIAVAGQTENLA